MNLEQLIKKAQIAMNEKGESLLPDGKMGPKTEAALNKYDFHVEAIKDDMTPIESPIAMPEHQPFIVTEPKFVVIKGVKFKDRGYYKTNSGKFSGLVVHYTVSGNSEKSAKGVVEWLASQGYGCMVMDLNGVIYVPEGFAYMTDYGYHAGVSKWNNRSSVSDVFAGMEICCWGKNPPPSVPENEIRTVTTEQGYVVAGRYQKYTEAQEKSLINFCLWAKKNNPEFSFDNVAGHDEIRREAGKLGDKQDPGGALSMNMTQFRELLKKH